VPQRKSGLKELRKNRRNRMHNLDIKTDLRKTIKGFIRAVEGKKGDEARAQLKIVYKKLDKAAKRHILHPNTAARRKSRLTRLAGSIQ